MAALHSVGKIADGADGIMKGLFNFVSPPLSVGEIADGVEGVMNGLFNLVSSPLSAHEITIGTDGVINKLFNFVDPSDAGQRKSGNFGNSVPTSRRNTMRSELCTLSLSSSLAIS